mmetsp:Transcript_32919/g.43387  ORF Transcript_32919/g.43387 Transcript_32919/m.43387 type:complete len:80 (+) Transcript_32919:232-471(+)
MPYTYCDLINDLEQSKKFLLAHEGSLVNDRPAKFLLDAKPLPDANKKAVSEVTSAKTKEERHVLTKKEIATRELKKIAI